MQTLIQDLRITTVVAGFNGGVSRRQNWIRSSCGDIPSDATGRTIEILKAGGLVPWLYTDTTCYVPDTKGPHVDRESKTVGFGPELLAEYSNYLDKAAKIVGVSDDLNAVAVCESKVRDELGAHVSAARSQPYYLDVTHPAANKGGVVEFLSAVALFLCGSAGASPYRVTFPWHPSRSAGRAEKCETGQLARSEARMKEDEWPGNMAS
jgi:hydroxymethylpyrimidine pyrophosphatase-like HAD family hydrolase